MRMVCGVAASALMALALFCEPAAAQCPGGYFQANASQPVGNFGATLNSTVCVLIATAPTQISLKSTTTAEILNVSKLQQAIVDRVAGSEPCSPTSMSGWDITAADVRFLGSSSSSAIRVDVVGRDCQALTAARVAYQAPLNINLTNNVLTASVDDANARVTSSRVLLGLLRGLISRKISERLNEALARPIDLNPHIPSYVRSLEPSVSDVSIVLQSRKLTLKVSVNGWLTKPVADKLLDEAVRDRVVPPLLRWIGRDSPMS
ncbi:MAG: hypothetical protein QOF14_1086 [Hyphomicrobiales bacterium]|nr:hypothetical protein [Hyphomicrobiales bacterium]